MSLIKSKLGYIATRKRVEEVDPNSSVELELFNKPFAFKKLYMPITDSYSLQKYGENVSRMLRMFVDLSWIGRVHVGDRAYLIDENNKYCDLNNLIYMDDQYCNFANYKVVSVEIQNLKIKIEFEKIYNND